MTVAQVVFAAYVLSASAALYLTGSTVAYAIYQVMRDDPLYETFPGSEKWLLTRKVARAVILSGGKAVERTINFISPARESGGESK